MKYYAAYGSNLNMEQMAARCPSALPIGTASINNHSLHFANQGQGRGLGYLNIEKDKGKRVPVGIWRIDEQDERNLDIYEGYPRLYEKKNVRLKVYPFAGEPFMATAMVYFMPHAVTTPPSPRYYETCEDGYRRFKLDMEYLFDALEEADEAEGCRASKEVFDRWDATKTEQWA